MKRLYFDMDGTVADLYGTEDWLSKLENEEIGLFANLEPLVDMKELQEICEEKIAQGWELGIISWTPMNASSWYHRQSAREKREWVKKYMPYIKNSEIKIQKYGTPKQQAITKRAKEMWLVDDNAEVVQTWATPKQRKFIVANARMLRELREL